MSFQIKHEDHFKLYVLVEDRFAFENALNNAGIEYYVNTDEQVYVAHSIRYFLKNEDRKKIDELIVLNGINSGIESIGVNRYEFRIIPLKYLVIFLLFVVIVFLLFTFI